MDSAPCVESGNSPDFRRCGLSFRALGEVPMKGCSKCGKQAISYYGKPGPRYNFKDKLCWECWVEDYGTDEQREKLANESK